MKNAISEFCGVEFAIASNSATSSLHISCAALGVEKNDEIWTSPISFVASANCARFCGADVDFVDIDPNTFNMCPQNLEKKLLERVKQKKRLPKVVIVVHMCGQSCDMARIFQLSKLYGFKIIEDASHAIGGYYERQRIGSCKYSDITVFSFHPVKIITTGEGGVATTKDEETARLMRLYNSHGITREVDFFQNKEQGPWYYEQQVLGFNYRMTDIQAALEALTIEQTRKFIEARNDLADEYNSLFSSKAVRIPFVKSQCLSSFHLYVIQFKDVGKQWSYKKSFEALRENGIGVNLHYIPIYRQPYYRELGYKLKTIKMPKLILMLNEHTNLSRPKTFATKVHRSKNL